ncbi:MAG: RluA family pseudouridine synthase [Candidatus Peribacteraceae bacterium]|nr:RluA family pseudouridine synthase [Candidatus Peribacteraceae bacterium]MDD5739185.1 RluA family pseudouridine synthase [Candidatus Peribacteraceae bacterium]
MSLSSFRLLFKDDSLLAVNKLSGELVVAGAGTSEKLSLLDFLRKEYPGLKPLHRLDFETSGVVVFARTKQVAEAVVTSKFNGWKKTYLTLVSGRMPRQEGVIRTPLPARGKGVIPALTTYRVLGVFANSCLVEADIETGRHHQIRRHFASIGHPLLLDEEYGNKGINRVFTREFHLRRFFLHAAKLSFPHPVTGKTLTIEAPLPRVFEGVLKQLRKL